MFVPHNHRLQLPSILTPRTQRTKKSAEVQLNRIKTYQNSCTATGSGFYSILYHFPTFAWFGLNNTHWLIKTIPRWDLESAHSHQEQTSGNKHTSFASEWQVNTKKQEYWTMCELWSIGTHLNTWILDVLISNLCY